MIEQSWNVLACAIEDDRVVYLDATITRDAAGATIAAIGEPQSVTRADFILGNPDDDQHDFDMEELARDVARRICEADHPIHFVAISTFGTVNVASGNVEYWPHAAGVIARRGKRIDVCFPDLIRNALDETGDYPTVIVDNDATAAALGEYAFGRGQGADEFAFIWAGRGINVGLVLNGMPWEGRLHPEAGHILVRRHDEEPDARGGCINHDGCMIGLASLRSIEVRAEAEMNEDRITDILAYYYAQLCMSVTLTTAPARIVIGGLVCRRLPALLERVRRDYARLIGEYPRYVQQEHEMFIAVSELSPLASVFGMIEMTRQRIERMPHD